MVAVTLKEAIDKAIQNEELSHKFYIDLIGAVEDTVSKDTLQFLANEEVTHKEILEKYQKGEFSDRALGIDAVVDARIVEHLAAPESNAIKEQKDLFLVAAKREKASHEFYEKMAQLHPEDELKKLFLKLANEELKHKEKVEYLYCNAAFPQTAGG
jgi:rubrerythrin